jgi:hypothetical protein
MTPVRKLDSGGLENLSVECEHCEAVSQMANYCVFGACFCWAQVEIRENPRIPQNDDY